MNLLDIHCPTCHRWLGRGNFAQLEMLCRCKTRILATPQETLVIMVAASVSKTFDGSTYVHGVMIS